MSATAIPTRDEYHFRLRKKVDALKARLNLPSLFTSKRTRDKVLCYFLGRAAEIGEACFRISDLPTPIDALARVLWEDFFTMYWVSLSKENAVAYSKTARSEMAKMMWKNLDNKRARLRRISSGEDVTAEFLPKLKRPIGKKKTVEQIAKESGLGRLYDIFYRFNSLEVHGNTFGLSEMKKKSEIDGIAAAVSAINALLGVILLIADNKDRTVTADEILSTLYPVPRQQP